MRALVQEKKWIKTTVPETISSLDLYLFGNVCGIPGGHWNYTAPVRPGAKEEYIMIDGGEL
jgi:hypothetical protein